MATVVIPTYNCGRFLAGAIESVRAQTMPDFELIVVDDGSSDTTAIVLHGYRAEPRMSVLRNERPLGPSAARNVGIKAANAPIVAFLDADDRWAPRCLEVHAKALASPGVGVSYIAATHRRASGDLVVRKTSPHTGVGLTRELLFSNTIPGSSSGIAIRKNCFEHVGVFDEELLAAEDRDMWLRLAQAFDFCYTDEILTTVERRRVDSAVRDHLRMAVGRERFLAKREMDAPEPLRPLLPKLRSSTFLHVARAHRAVGLLSSSRRYSARAILSCRGIDLDLVRGISQWMRSFWRPISGVRAQIRTSPVGSEGRDGVA